MIDFQKPPQWLRGLLIQIQTTQDFVLFISDNSSVIDLEFHDNVLKVGEKITLNDAFYEVVDIKLYSPDFGEAWRQTPINNQYSITIVITVEGNISEPLPRIEL